MTQIVQKDDPVLRKVAMPVSKDTVSSEKIRSIIQKMKEALDSQNDGVAIAAPQIGESLRIVVISEKAFHTKDLEKKHQEENKEKMVLINPEIIKQSKKRIWMEEGCLSVRWLYGETRRSEKTTVCALDKNGTPFTYGGSALLSQIFQHEIDHLNGILFIDHARNVAEVKPENQK